MLAILSFKPYAKSTSLSVRFLFPLRCATFTNEATPSHEFHDLIVCTVQTIASSSQDFFRCINEFHLTLDQLLDDNKH